MNDEVRKLKSIFTKGHIIMSAVLLGYALLQSVTTNEKQIQIIIISTAVLVLIDLSLFCAFLSSRHILWGGLRYVEICIVSVGMLKNLSNMLGIFFALYLIMSIIELEFVHDFTDNYTRVMVTVSSSAPIIVYLIYRLLKRPSDQRPLCYILLITVMIYIIVLLITQAVSMTVIKSDRKVFDLSRLSERLKQSNEALKIQQQKIKQANEQLGIQKIELESANERVNRSNMESNMQNMILRYISTSIELATLLELITESVSEAFGLDLCVIMIRPEIAGNKSLLYKIRARFPQKEKELLDNNFKKISFKDLFIQDVPLVDNEVFEGKYPFLEGISMGSLLMIPLIKDEVVLGGLICAKQQQKFFVDSIQFFENVVAQLLLAIHNASLYEKVQQMAIRDAMTGIYNRGHLNLLLNKYECEMLGQEGTLSIVLFDIDHFKRVNDTYGHLFGDTVIKSIASTASNVADQYQGIAARYGGEEFVLLLPNKGIEQVIEIIKVLQNKIACIQLKYREEQVSVRVSIGLSNYPQSTTVITELLNRADEAMYQAKENGRNQFVVDMGSGYIRQNEMK